ncbi:hypothetical protein [Sphingobium sp.]|uniref:hypothetical protein n=1 Tax=Sphingobium sp. TaxID=1912891 RepID=UPI003B3A2DC5
MERIIHLNDENGQSGELIVEYNIDTGRARSAGKGFGSVKQMKSFFADWKEVVQCIHAHGLRVIAMVDLSEGDVQKAEVAEVIATATADIYRKGDTIAMIVRDSLMKMQMRRILDGDFYQFFVSRSAAGLWLDGRSQRRF